MSEPFNPVKLVTSPFTALFWLKTLMFGLGLAFLGMVGWAFYVAYFQVPDPTTTQNNRAAVIYYSTPSPRSSWFGCSIVKTEEHFQKPPTNRMGK